MTKHLSNIYGTNAATAQTVKDRDDQVANNAGGFVFQVDDWNRLERFLILGTEGGTYYVKEQKHARDNAKVVERCIAKDGKKTVQTIVNISKSGRAPKNDYAIFALAMCASFGDAETKSHALANLPEVARIGTHLFMFTDYVESMRKWSRGLRNAYKNWYDSKPADKLAVQLVKYQSRSIEGQPGWSHDDVLRKSHYKPTNTEKRELLQWVTEGWSGFDEDRAIVKRCINRSELAKIKGKGLEKKYENYFLTVPSNLKVIEGFERAKRETDPKKVAKLVREYNLTREMIPTESLNSPEVWEALLEKMPYTALIRNLGNMSKAGILGPNSDGAIKVMAQLANGDALKKARVHPIKVLAALLTYSQGHGFRGKGTWDVNQQIVESLDNAFYLAFNAITPANKRFFIGQDVSGSMTSECGQVPGLTCSMASAAIAMVTMRTEPFFYWYGFGDHGGQLKISPKERLDAVTKKISGLNCGGTDCALPMIDALKMKMPVDTFVILTDSETYAGTIKPHQALVKYRDKMGIDAKLVVVGMTATGFTIADPNDSGSLDVVGFDTNVPEMISNFSRGSDLGSAVEEE